GNDELRRKLDDAKLTRLPLPQLLGKLGLSAHAKKTARCPFPDHEDKHPSFSVFQGEGGFWRYKCFATCGEGDEIQFLRKLKGLSMTEAMKLYLDMAGFPPCASPKSPEYLQSRASHEPRGYRWSPESPVSPVSNGQRLGKDLQEELEGLGFYNACEEHGSATQRRFKLARDVKALEKRIRRKLTTAEVMLAFNEWHGVSQPFLDSGETREDHLTMFLAELTKVRVPAGEGDTFNKALECVSVLSDQELPEIPDMPDAPEPWRRLAALHRELSRLSTNKDNTYFLSYRDAAKASSDLSPQRAHDITRVLERLHVIKIVRVGVARPRGGKASELRYLSRPQSTPLNSPHGLAPHRVAVWRAVVGFPEPSHE